MNNYFIRESRLMTIGNGQLNMQAGRQNVDVTQLSPVDVMAILIFVKLDEHRMQQYYEY